MKKIFILTLLLLNNPLLFSQVQIIQLTDSSKISVTDNIEIGSKLTLKKKIYSTIVADIEYCGKSPLDNRNFKSAKIGKDLYKKITKSYSAYLIKQNHTQLYVHCLSDTRNISCEPQKNVKLKILILKLYDRQKKANYNLMLLQ